ncbi:MAG: hypothetical protein KC731_09510 [Myxococcales bacterium]|nr:hypothetical protein [Myxococcales bacterium]
MHGAARALPLVMGLWSAGCFENTSPPCQHILCDIEDPDCVEETAKVVACDMGLEEASPKVRLRTAAQVLAEVEAEQEPLTAEMQHDFDSMVRGMAVLGLLPEGYQREQATADGLRNLLGYYERDSKAITIITDRARLSHEAEYQVLVHEIVHFYQDRQRDLSAYFDVHATTKDRSMGTRAVTEGEASLRDDLAGLQVRNLTPDDVDWSAYFGDWQAQTLDRVFDSDLPLIDAESAFPYSYGAALLHGAWSASSQSGIDAVFARPPDSARQAMAGYQPQPSSWNEDGDFDPTALPVLPADYELADYTHMGIWLLNAALSRTADTGKWAPALDEVTADFLTIFHHAPSDGVAAIWRIRTRDLPTLRNTFLHSGSTWSAAPAVAQRQRVVGEVDGELVAVATTEELDANEVLATITGWTQAEDATTSFDAASFHAPSCFR